MFQFQITNRCFWTHTVQLQDSSSVHKLVWRLLIYGENLVYVLHSIHSRFSYYSCTFLTSTLWTALPIDQLLALILSHWTSKIQIQKKKMVWILALGINRICPEP